MKDPGKAWRTVGVAGLLAWGAFTVPVTAAEPMFTQDFNQVELGAKLPDGFLDLGGNFEVKEEGGERFLELPGAPLESFGVMFGPGNKENWGAQAKFWSTRQGRRFPVFGLSINTVGGYRIQVAPAKRAIELLKGDEVKATFAYVWESGTWTQLRIQIRKTGENTWRVEGKAWKDAQPEPEEWMVAWEEKETPIAGRAVIWGNPFSGMPIRFDDLKILAAEE